MSLAGIDIGTTGAKVTVFNADGHIIAQAYREYPLSFPRAGWMTLDSARVISEAHAALAEAAGKSRKDPIRAICASSLGEAATPVDAAGRPLAEAVTGFDTRGEDECRELIETISREKLFRITGAPPNHIFTVCKILWLKKNRPALFRRAKQFLLFEDLFIRSLGFEAIISHSLAARTMAFDNRKMKWSGGILGMAGLDENIFARPAAAGTIIGEIPGATLKKLGLPRGCVAVTGGHDQICGALGAGIIRPGTACDATGTVECITLCLPKAAANKRMLENNFCCSPHAVPGLYATLAFNFTGGSLLRWFRDNFAQAETSAAKASGRDVYHIIIGQAAKNPTGLFVLPHFTTSGTPHFDPAASGAILGLRFDTCRAEIIRAILEGITLEMRLNIDLLEDAGLKVDELHAIGGGARSPFWLQLKADVFGRPVTALDIPEATGLGAALIAGIATGQYASHEQAAAATVRKNKRYIPDKKNKAFYDDRLEDFRRIYPALKKLNM